MRTAIEGLAPIIQLERGAERPLHRQICDGFRAAILRGDLHPGQRVPSSRALAVELGVSRLPALSAYEQLLSEGYFEARAGSGTFVCRRLSGQPLNPAGVSARPAPTISLDPAPPESAGRRLADAGARFPARESFPWARGWGAFGVHQPALEAFPFPLWARLAARHSRNTDGVKPVELNGLTRFREAICTYLRTARAVRCDPGQIVIVSGSQQALDIAARVLLDPGDQVWMEEPGYWLARHLLQGAGCRVVPVPVDGDGLNVASGLARSPRARAAYVTPSHQFPLGATMSAARRMELLGWAQASGAWIIEDDYDSEFRYESQPIGALQGLDAHARVLYIGTFSKVMFPGLRLGYLVVPADLVDRFVSIRYAMDIFPPTLPQAMLCDFMQEGYFARHLRRMRQVYRERRAALVDSLRTICGPELEVQGSEAGMHLVVTLPSKWVGHDRVIAAAAAAKQLWIWPLSPAYVTERRRQGFILGYGSTAAADMPAAVRRLRSLLR